MDFFFYLIVFFLGTCVGSFLNSIIYRLKIGESFLFKRSYCPHCKHILGWQDLIPILSFLALKGRCRYCQKPISWQYPLVELATGILFVSIFQLTISNQQSAIYLFRVDSLDIRVLSLLYYLLITCLLIIIFVYDLKHFIIPDKIIYPAIALALISNLFQSTINNQQSTINNFFAAILASAFFLLIFLLSRGKWMGFGDVKLAFFMGLFLGFPKILTALFLAFFIGALVGTVLIILGKKTLKSKVPFAPFLIIGTFLSLFWGNIPSDIMNIYMNFGL